MTPQSRSWEDQCRDRDVRCGTVADHVNDEPLCDELRRICGLPPSGEPDHTTYPTGRDT